jgi:hypothetical protein
MVVDLKRKTMIQMLIDPELVLDYDFTRPEVNRTLKNLQPVVFRDGEAYGCLLGPDLETGILGKGASPEEAIYKWEENLQKRIQDPADDDEVAEFVIDTLRLTKDDVW